MPTRINIHQRIIYTIAIPVKRLQIPRFGNNAVCRDKPAYLRIVEPGVIVIQLGFVIILLIGEGIVHLRKTRGG